MSNNPGTLAGRVTALDRPDPRSSVVYVTVKVQPLHLDGFGQHLGGAATLHLGQAVDHADPRDAVVRRLLYGWVPEVPDDPDQRSLWLRPADGKRESYGMADDEAAVIRAAREATS